MWVPLFHASSIAKIDIKTRKATYYPLPIDSTPYFLVVDKNHVVWTNLLTDDRVARFDPKSEAWTFFRLPTHGWRDPEHRHRRRPRRRLGAVHQGEQDRAPPVSRVAARCRQGWRQRQRRPLVPWNRDGLPKSRSAAPGWPGAKSEHIGHM